METYYVIVGTDYKIVNTTKNDKQHTPITLYNYPFISKFTLSDNNEIAEVDNIPMYYTSYSTLEITPNKWCVGLLKITITTTSNGSSKRVEHQRLGAVELAKRERANGLRPSEDQRLINQVITHLLTNDRYRRYITTTSAISYDDVFRFITSDYLIRYSPKHDYVYIPIDYTTSKPCIVLSNVYGVSKDLKHAERVFPNVVSSTTYTPYKHMRENIKYNHTIAKELLYTLFDKLLTLSTTSLLDIVNNPSGPQEKTQPVYNQFELIDSSHRYVLLGEEHTI